MAATLRATTAGLDLVDQYRCKKGWKKKERAWAELAITSQSTPGRFWSRIPIGSELFKGICLAVGIEDWEQIIDYGKFQDRRGTNALASREAKGHVIITLDVNLEDISPEDWHQVSTRLAKYGMKLTDMAEGSIKLLLEGSPEDIERIKAEFDAGGLSSILATPVQSVQSVDSEGLAKWIRENDGIDLQLSSVNLRGADLREADLFRASLRGANLREAYLFGANLSSADLSSADLSEADLSGANLSSANLFRANVPQTRFSLTKGLLEEQRRDLVERGAIFEDAPGEESFTRSPVPSGRR